MFKYLAIPIIRAILHIFYIFPINKKKVFFSSFECSRFFCNPKYIFLDLYDKMPKLEYVWCIDEKYSELLEYDNVITVKSDTLLYLYHILTAKIIITNIFLRSFLPYRKNQIIVNTWHGGGAYKKVGFANYNSEKERKYWRSKMRMKFGDTTGKNVTWFISSCKAFSDVMHESYRIAYNKYLSVGMPRNDIFFRANTDLIISLKNKLNISMNTGIVLYAPTHRSNVNHSLDVMNCAINYLNIDMIINILKERFKKEFVCLFRGHPGFLSKLQCSGTINVSSYNDMQELLLIADVLITDYSSSIWDFSLTKKPCFLFTPDLDLYLSHDRGFYTPIEEWPYPFARTNEELCNNIMNFDQLKHEAKIKKHHEDLGSYEQGTATSKVTELLQKIFEKP